MMVVGKALSPFSDFFPPLFFSTPNQHCSGIARKESTSAGVLSAPGVIDILPLLFKVKGRCGVQTQIKLYTFLISFLSIKKRCGLFLRMAFGNDPCIGNGVVAKGQTIGKRDFMVRLEVYLLEPWHRGPC